MTRQHMMTNMQQCRDEYLADANEAMDKWFSAVSSCLSVEAQAKIRHGRIGRITGNRILSDFEKVLAYRRIIIELESEVSSFEKAKTMD